MCSRIWKSGRPSCPPACGKVAWPHGWPPTITFFSVRFSRGYLSLHTLLTITITSRTCWLAAAGWQSAILLAGNLVCWLAAAGWQSEMLLVCWLTAAGRQSCWLAILWAGLLAGCGLLAIGSLSLAGNLAGWFAGWLRLAGNQVRSSFVLHGMLTQRW